MLLDSSWRTRIGLCGTIAVVLFSAFFTGCSVPKNVADSQSPNVLIILADDLGYSDLSVMGGEIPTPNIDRLADEGILFTNFHVAATCSPTRAMLLTGADSHRVGLGNMGEFLTDAQRGQDGYEGHLNETVETLASRLQRLGYRTGMAGKWHLSAQPDQRPHARGFGRTFALMEGSGSAWDDGSPAPIIGNRTHFTRDGKPVERPEGFSATLYVDAMIDFIRAADGDAPFFGYLAFQAVHWPHHAPAKFIERSRGLYDEGWRQVHAERVRRQREMGLFDGPASSIGDEIPNWQDLSASKRRDEAARMEAYAAMAMAMDHEIGRLLAFLESSGRLDQTLVLFLSDNGADPSEPERSTFAGEWYKERYPVTDPERLGSPGSFPSTGHAWARVSVAPLADHKGQPGEGGLRVPLIARYPSGIPAKSQSSRFGFVTDVVPTVLDAVTASRPSHSFPDKLDGLSLWNEMRGTALDEAGGQSRAVGYELMGASALFAGDLKLVRRHGEPWRLFDVATDLGEQVDLSRHSPERKARLLRAYDAYESEMGVIAVPADFDVMKQLLSQPTAPSE